MSGGVYGNYPVKSEIPFELGTRERREKSAGGGVNVDGDVVASFGLISIKMITHLLHWLVVTGLKLIVRNKL